MVDNISVTAGSGTVIGADDIGSGVLAQRVKPVWGPDGTGNDTDIASGKSLPVQVRSATGLIPLGEPTDAKSASTDTTSVSAIALLKQLSAYLAGAGVIGLNTQAYTAKVSVTRPSNATAYTAGDVVGVTGGGTACITFANMGPGAGDIMITSASLERDVAALASGELNYYLHLYNVTQPSALADNAVFDIPSGDRASYLGAINLGTPAIPLGTASGSTIYVSTEGINKQITLASTSLFGVLVTAGGYTPSSAAVHLVTLHAVKV